MTETHTKTVEATSRSKYKISTLESLSESLRTDIRSIPSHEQAAPTPIEARRPASTFLDEELYRLELNRVFRRFPVAVTLSALLPEAGSVLAHEGYGIPLLLTRGKDGRVRTFLNACQHRGAKLIEDCEPHKMSLISCPYHAWSYALDGRLVGVPRQETFLNLDKTERRLAELPCKEAGGIIWVILNREADPDFSEIVPQLVSDLDSIGIAGMHVYGHRSYDLKANWKLVAEPFYESYHVQRLHAKSLEGLFADVPGTSRSLGPHNRQISGKANFTPALLERVNESIHKTVTIGYQIFPNTMIITSPYYISVMIIMPRGLDKTTVEYFMITHSPPDTEKAEEIYSRSYAIIQKVFGTEDFRAAELAQAGIASGALKELVYCGLEANIPDFYEVLDKHLAG